MPSLYHVVLVHATPDANGENIKQICNEVLALKDKCVKGSKKYIKSAQGGKDRSIEGQQGGITHAFIIEFESEEDRDYYVKEDSQHAAVRDRLIASVGVDIATAQVVDFSPDAF